jgi:hypothetical protein
MTLPRVMFASYHCFRDPSSGAAVCTRDLFSALSKRGCACSVFTGPHLDDRAAPPMAIALRDRPGIQTIPGRAGPYPFALLSCVEAGGYPVALFATDPPAAAKPPTPSDTAAFLAVLADHLGRFRPDAVLT